VALGFVTALGIVGIVTGGGETNNGTARTPAGFDTATVEAALQDPNALRATGTCQAELAVAADAIARLVTQGAIYTGPSVAAYRSAAALAAAHNVPCVPPSPGDGTYTLTVGGATVTVSGSALSIPAYNLPDLCTEPGMTDLQGAVAAYPTTDPNYVQAQGDLKRLYNLAKETC